MASQYNRLFDTRVLTSNAVAPAQSVLDLGAFTELVIDPRVLVMGTGSLVIETAAVNEEGAWRVVHTINLSAAASMVQISSFLRYVRWRVDGAVTGTPTVLIDLVAKGG